MNLRHWLQGGFRVAAAGVLACSATAMAGEPKSTPKPDEPAGEDKKPAPTDEPPFDYQEGGRRDPFTFKREFPIPAKIEKPLVQGPGDTQQVQKGDENERLLLLVKEAEAKYAEAERFLIELSGTSVVEKADEALKLFKPTDNAVIVREIREKLLRIRIAGVRMKNRQDAQSEFERLNIRVTGVVAKERQSQAIINTKDTRIVGKGDLLPLGEAQEVVVEEILPEQVIVLYKGYKMILTMNDAPAAGK